MTVKVEITRLPLVKSVLRSRWPQLLVRTLALAGFLLAILAGILGTPVGSRNFTIVFVWIAWWALLMLLAVPFFGRAWCSICPIPLPGEWLQSGALLQPNGKGWGLGKRWPKSLRSIWLQNIAFALLALFSSVVLTNPLASAAVLAVFLLAAVFTSLVYERRAFCRYLCPVSGFIGLYSQLAPIELRVKDSQVCAAHTEKTCYTGSAAGYGCPWGVFPPGLTKNTNCGTCMECLRTCPHDNIAIQLRAPGADLLQPLGRKLDEAYKAFIMLGSAAVYSGVMLGPWGFLKSAASSVGSLPWLVFAVLFLISIFVLLPGLFLLAVAAGQRLAGKDSPAGRLSRKKAFTTLAYCLVPLGLMAWVAFSLSFVFTNLSYVWPALSDPFGWGWDLLGSASVSWTPYMTGALPWLQVIALLVGVSWACRTALQLAGQIAGSAAHPAAIRLSTPVIMFCLVVTVGLLGLLIA